MHFTKISFKVKVLCSAVLLMSSLQEIKLLFSYFVTLSNLRMIFFSYVHKIGKFSVLLPTRPL